MSPFLFALVLAAAVLHAAWNALLRGATDRLWGMTAMSFATTLGSAIWATTLPWPAAAAWPWIIGSAALQTGYSLFLVRAYQFGELGQVYPIARGSAPLLVTLAAAFVAREHLPAHALAGIAAISAGLMGLISRIDKASRTPVLLALATGVLIAAYTTVDGLGVRRAGSSAAYAAWMFLFYGAMMAASYVAIRGWRGTRFGEAQTLRALGGGTLSLIVYSSVMYAMARAPIGAVSALRETSVVFAALLGHAFLGERLTARRLLACVVIASGVAALGW